MLMVSHWLLILRPRSLVGEHRLEVLMYLQMEV